MGCNATLLLPSRMTTTYRGTSSLICNPCPQLGGRLLSLSAHVDVFLEHVEYALAAGLADAHPRVQEANPRGAQDSVCGDPGDVLDPGEHVAHNAAAQKLTQRLCVSEEGGVRGEGRLVARDSELLLLLSSFGMLSFVTELSSGLTAALNCARGGEGGGAMVPACRTTRVERVSNEVGSSPIPHPGA